MRPASTGHVHITSDNPITPPKIQYNFLSAQLDIDTTINAVRIARAIMTAPAMGKLGVKEISPGETVTSDDQLLDWIKDNAETTYHPVGTCKMGNDPYAVVDHELKVYGIESLRVADASIMPTLISGNTNAPSIMIGEKAADMILY
jgi:choline dehydrogenase